MEKAIPKNRELEIDVLRAGSMLVMMVMHVNVYYLGDKFTYIFWSYSQWVVPAFILCSFAVRSYSVENIRDYFRYIVKRFKRLLIPYYIWLIFYWLTLFILSQQVPNLKSILSNIFLTGGIGYNWLVVLFVFLTIAGPLMMYGIRQNKIVGLALFGIGVIASLVFWKSQNYWNPHFRLAMIAPWVAITVSQIYFLDLIRQGRKKLVYLFVGVAFVIFWGMYFYNIVPNKMKIDLYTHKYPPNIYFLVYCLWTTPIAYLVANWSLRYLQLSSHVMNAISYVSRNSYQIFFIHVIVIEFVHKFSKNYPVTYQQYLLVLFVFTFLINEGWNRIVSRSQL